MSNTGKKTEVSKNFLLILPRLSKKVLENFQFFQKKSKELAEISNTKNKQLYVQASSFNIKKILKIKENFPNLFSKKIKEIHKTINELGKHHFFLSYYHLV